MLKAIAWIQFLVLALTANFLMGDVSPISETRSSAIYLWSLILLLFGMWWVSWLSDRSYRQSKAMTDLMTNVLVIAMAAASVPLLEVDVVAIALIVLYLLRQLAVGITAVVIPTMGGINTVRATTSISATLLAMTTVVLLPIT